MNHPNRRIDSILNHLNPQTHILNNILTNPCSGNGKRLLEGDVAIITGSGQGIGAETAKLFAREGANVVVSDIDSVKAEKIVQEIKSEGGNAISVNGDVTDVKFPQLLIQKTIETFGKLTILVLNAGFTWDGMVQNITDEQYLKMLEVHNIAPFRIVKAASPYMREAAKKEIESKGSAIPRSIIFISSTSGLHGNIGQANYATAKMGVVGLNKTIAKEWGQFNIRSNAVAFGLIETRLTSAKTEDNKIQVNGKEVKLGIPEPLIKNRQQSLKLTVPLGRAGSPIEAAGSILLLCSPYASYITGHTLEVTGGAGI